jgi:hypothetical protein
MRSWRTSRGARANVAEAVRVKIGIRHATNGLADSLAASAGVMPMSRSRSASSSASARRCWARAWQRESQASARRIVATSPAGARRERPTSCATKPMSM